MLQVALLARMGHCPRLTLVLRYWWTCDTGGALPFSGPPPGSMLLLGEEGPGSVPTDDLVSVAAVPLPAVRDLMFAQSPVEGLVRECEDVTEESITVYDGWSDLEVVRTPAVVAMLGMNALPMTVYYGSDLCDESDWDDPDDIAREEYVYQYDFDVLEGMDLMVFE